MLYFSGSQIVDLWWALVSPKARKQWWARCLHSTGMYNVLHRQIRLETCYNAYKLVKYESGKGGVSLLEFIPPEESDRKPDLCMYLLSWRKTRELDRKYSNYIARVWWSHWDTFWLSCLLMWTFLAVIQIVHCFQCPVKVHYVSEGRGGQEGPICPHNAGPHPVRSSWSRTF